MKRAVVSGVSEEGYRSLIVVDAVQPHLTIRDAIDAALIGDVVGSEVDIQTYEVADDTPGHCTPKDVEKATNAIRRAEGILSDDGWTPEALAALADARELLGWGS